MTNDDLSVVLVKRLTNGTLHDQNALQENMKYSGDKNPFTFQRCYDLDLRCSFIFYHYPFDHQHCNIEVRKYSLGWFGTAL